MPDTRQEVKSSVYGDLQKATHAAFRFVVEVGGDKQGVFTECTLPAIEWEVEEVKEGGLNTYTHQLPGRRKGMKITLKNGVATTDLMKWYFSFTGEEKLERRPVTVILFNSMRKPVMTWNIQGAYPVKWTGPQLKASENSIAIQTLELACGEITIA